MNASLLKAWVWTKIGLIGLIVLYAGLFVWNNAGKVADPWLFFGLEPAGSLLLFAVLTFALGAVTAVLAGAIFRTAGQLRGVRQRERTDRLEREVAEMRSRTDRAPTRP